MGKKVIVAVGGIVLIAMLIAILLLNSSSPLNSVLRQANINIGISPLAPANTLYEIDTERAKQVLRELGYKETTLEVRHLSGAPQENGLLLPDADGSTAFGTHISSDGRDTLTWSIYVNPEFAKHKDSNGNEVEAKSSKQRGMSHLSIRSFITFSQNPQRNVDMLYPIANTPILIKLK
jgi:hypothetical protein